LTAITNWGNETLATVFQGLKVAKSGYINFMQRNRYLLVGVLSLVSPLFAEPGRAQTDNPATNPYEAIVGRNVFGLKDPPPPVDPTATQKVEPPKMKLQGISTILGRKQVLVKVLAKPPTRPKDESLVIDEKMRKGELEVLEIDENAGTVKFNNNGEIVTLSMNNPDDIDRPTPGAAPPPMPPPPVPGMSGGVVPQPPANAGGGSTVTTFGGIPQRPMRGGNTTSYGTQGGVAPGGGTSIPTGASDQTVEANVLMYELNRVKNEEARKAGSKVPPMPPHVFLKDKAPQ
jgi:hypothetical protein